MLFPKSLQDKNGSGEQRRRDNKENEEFNEKEDGDVIESQRDQFTSQTSILKLFFAGLTVSFKSPPKMGFVDNKKNKYKL